MAFSGHNHVTSQKKANLTLWAVLVPFIGLAAAAAYLHLRWNSVPPRFPVHWAADGQPNDWASRNWRGVYGPVLFGACLDMFLMVLAWIISRVRRTTMMQYVTVQGLQFLLYPLTLSFVLISLRPLARIPIWTIPSLTLAGIAGLFYWSYKKITTSSSTERTSKPSSEGYWKAGLFYWNPNDSAILVPKRVGVSYTFNFANKWSWVAVIAIVAAILLPILLRAH